MGALAEAIDNPENAKINCELNKVDSIHVTYWSVNGVTKS